MILLVQIRFLIFLKRKVDLTNHLGMWKWPETRAGKTVSFPCFHSGSVMGQLKWTATEVYLDRFSRRRVPLVYRECLVDGIWSISNSSACDSIMPTWKSFVKVYSVRVRFTLLLVFSRGAR